jgi:hypothetical protein
MKTCHWVCRPDTALGLDSTPIPPANRALHFCDSTVHPFKNMYRKSCSSNRIIGRVAPRHSGLCEHCTRPKNRDEIETDVV